MPKKGGYYAVANGRNVGIYKDWNSCNAQVSGYSNASFKRFSTKEEASNFIRQNRYSPGYSRSSRYSKKSERVVHSNKDDDDGFVDVYTDGACGRNGQSGAKAGIGVWWGPDHPLNVSEPVTGSRATNNTAEIQAATRAVKDAIHHGYNKLRINTDSKFLKDCVESWMPKWKENGWKTTAGHEAINKRDLQDLDQAMDGIKVEFRYVPAHSGVHGNEKADQLAVRGAEKY